MRTSLLFVWILALLIFSACAQTSEETTKAATKTTAQILKHEQYINDFESVFSAAERTSLLDLVSAFEKETGITIEIASFDTTMVNKDKFDDFTLAMANKWEIGKSNSNKGVLIGFSKGHRMIRINNGYGIERLITDEETKTVIDTFFITNFKKGNYYEGTLKGTQELMKLLKDRVKKL